MGNLRKKSSNEEVLKDKAFMSYLCAAVALRQQEAVAKAAEAVRQMNLPPLGREEAERMADAAIRAEAQFKEPLPNPSAVKCGGPLPQSSRIDRRVEEAVNAYFKQVRREAKDRAYERLYRLNARGVEWYRAAQGVIYLADERQGMLRSLERAAFNTDGPWPDLPIGDNGIVSRVYRRGTGEMGTGFEGQPSGSALAVPIYAPGRNKPLGAYLVKTDRPGAFTPAQVRELHRQVIFFTPHLFVLDALDKVDDFSTWPYHPEVHSQGWSLEPLLRGFCRAVAESLRTAGARPPACTLWTADWEKNRCWVLAAHGYDYSFLDLDTLGPNSAVARVAGSRQRTIEYGTPHDLKFVCPEKAQEMGVRQVIIASLHDYADEPFSGTLNVTFFDERGQHTLPSRGLVGLLAERAERLVASLYAQRARLALAYRDCELARVASPGQHFGALLRTALRCLDAPVGSIFARVPNTRELQCVETTGLEEGDFRKVTYDLDDPRQPLTCWAALHPGQVARLNWGPVEVGVIRPKGQPTPSNRSRERMVPEGSYRRRSLTTGLAMLKDDPNPEPLGAIRVLRPARSRPFTSADERLLVKLAATSEDLFKSWVFARNHKVAVQSFNSPLARIEEVAQGCVSGCADRGFPIVQASVFVRDDRSLPEPEYRWYTSEYPRDRGLRAELIVRGERIPKPTRDQVIAPTSEQSGKIIVLKSVPLEEGPGMRICAPIQVWSGHELVEALLALDFNGSGHTWPSDRKLKVFQDVRKLSAIWASNPYWHPSPDLLEGGPRDVVREYLSECLCASDSLICWAELRLLDRGQYRLIDAVGDAPKQLFEAGACPDPELQRFGVRLDADATYCVFPLLLGPFRAGEVVCGLRQKFANDLKRFLPQSGRGVPPSSAWSASEYEPEALQKLRDVTVRVTGPWCRVIAGNLLLWDVGFVDDRDEQDKVIWNEEISLKPELLQASETAPDDRVAASS